MSWAEVKKLNSDLSTPLNIASLINHIDMIGSSYTGNPSEAVELMKSNALYSHDIAKNVVYGLSKTSGATATAMAEYCETKLSASTGVGEWLAFIGNIEDATLIACDDMTAIAASETAMAAVIASETAMTAVANSETAMTAVFGTNSTPNYMTREKIWDSVSASTIVMGSTTSRAWLVANVQKTVEETSSTTFVLKVAKKCLVLSLERFGESLNTAPAAYRYVQPGNTESGLEANGTRIENTRVSTLEVKSGGGQAGYMNARVYYVQMQA